MESITLKNITIPSPIEHDNTEPAISINLISDINLGQNGMEADQANSTSVTNLPEKHTNNSINCNECGKLLGKTYIKKHIITFHNIEKQITKKRDKTLLWAGIKQGGD